MMTTALEKSQEARKIWLTAETQDDLDQVEGLLRDALNAKQSSKSTSKNKTKKRQRQQYAELSKSDYRKAAERLSLLYCQSGRTEKAKYGLNFLGFTCRLAKSVLDYPFEKKHTSAIISNFKKKSSKNSKNTNATNCPCIILDNFLHTSELEHLQGVFEDLHADYWVRHSYQVEPPSPYFSYVIDLKRSSNVDNGENNMYGFIGHLARQIRQLPELQAKFPELPQTRYVEMWAHNRPHASGHQLHFDSDDEGRGGVRNPVCSTILYLSNDENNSSMSRMVGGPSLVTNQRLSSTSLATKGWLAHPKPLRLVAFDGRVLHGVIPGKGVQIGRRTTLMMAFWKNIEVRDEPTHGSARPFPNQTSDPAKQEKTGKKDMPNWAKQLTDPDMQVSKRRPKSMKEQMPISLTTVYETLDGKPWKPTYGMPDYEQVFQGF